ncbi:hypothetical protein C8R43DRAFT_1047991 [Mycena crocata]|nr:hypothetical protein C8R43DRAFT_1047991 [Mycena crocata]
MKISQLLCSPPAINPVTTNEAVNTRPCQCPADREERFLFNSTSTDVATEKTPLPWKVWDGHASGVPSNNTETILTMRTNRCSICKVPGHKRDGCPRRATGWDINRHHASHIDEDTQVKMIEYCCSVCHKRGHRKNTCPTVTGIPVLSQYKCHRVRARCSLCNAIGHNRRTCSAVEWKCIGIEDLQ